MLPRPPNRLAPPMTAAAIAINRMSLPPELWFTAASRLAARMPPSAARVPQPANASTRIASN